MTTATDQLTAIHHDAKERVEQLVGMALDSEAHEDLRQELLKWLDAIMSDTLIHLALYMIGFGQVWVTDQRNHLAADHGLTEDQTSQLKAVIDDAEERVKSVAKASLKAESSQQATELLKGELSKWIESADADVLQSLSMMMIGTNIVFGEYVLIQ